MKRPTSPEDVQKVFDCYCKKILKNVRRTVNYKRQRGFEKVRKRMEEKQHEEE